jgi:hypothetical protein
VATATIIIPTIGLGGERRCDLDERLCARGDPWGRAPRRWRCAPIGFLGDWRTRCELLAARQASLRSFGSVFLSRISGFSKTSHLSVLFSFRCRRSIRRVLGGFPYTQLLSRGQTNRWRSWPPSWRTSDQEKSPSVALC